MSCFFFFLFLFHTRTKEQSVLALPCYAMLCHGMVSLRDKRTHRRKTKHKTAQQLHEHRERCEHAQVLTAFLPARRGPQKSASQRYSCRTNPFTSDCSAPERPPEARGPEPPQGQPGPPRAHEGPTSPCRSESAVRPWAVSLHVHRADVRASSLSDPLSSCLYALSSSLKAPAIVLLVIPAILAAFD